MKQTLNFSFLFLTCLALLLFSGCMERGIQWVRKQAEDGDALAQYTLAGFYHRGNNVPQDRVEAAKWYRKAAEQGLDIAQVRLGMYYLVGTTGVPQDREEAIKWLRKAAEQGNSQAIMLMRQFQETDEELEEVQQEDEEP